VIDFDRFVEPIAGDNACGPDCEYDNDFLALSQATAGKRAAIWRHRHSGGRP
jgi:hypothetical protein